ncbi:hypothetical protein HKX48_009517 [Thoreauomyces humboldtii]|nr:hypothetical protein HKX48_009517 [Thoreauomyces humboldtii]
MGNILALDIVGHGKSEKVPNKDAYTTESITKDILALLDIYKPKADSFILVGHSYGCTLVTHAYARLHPRPKALVLLCPKSLPSAHDREKLAKFSGAPTWLIDVLRVLDRRGGVNSPSVNRLLGRGAPLPLRKRQMAWNQAHATRIAQMMFEGANFAPADLYTAIDCPVLLVSSVKVTATFTLAQIYYWQIGGEEDTVCPVKADLEVVHAWLSASPTASVSEPFVIPNAGHQVMLEQPDLVNAIIYNWLIECGFDKLNLAAQLQTKNPSVSKWSLKNYAKWQKVQPVSLSPVRTSLFRPMKTMKQDDPSHTPAIFGRRHPEIGLIIDISAEAPPYVPADLPPPTTYLKLATTSKIPPTREEVKRFGDAAQAFWRKNPDAQVGVHCHYGFNRTGFVVCCYLIERCGVTVRDAIAAFEEARSPGIRHIHFKVRNTSLAYSLP